MGNPDKRFLTPSCLVGAQECGCETVLEHGGAATELESTEVSVELVPRGSKAAAHPKETKEERRKEKIPDRNSQSIPLESELVTDEAVTGARGI